MAGAPVRFIHGHNTRVIVTWADKVARVIAGDASRHSDGYRLLYLPMHPNAKNGYVYEHRVIAERKYGRFLASHEYVHHKNEDRLDNRPENLEVVSGSAHQIIHRSGISDERVMELLRAGWTHSKIIALGVAGQRVARLRRELRAR